MANVKYQIKEFTPSGNQKGSHSFYAERVINNTIDNTEMADKIAARTGFKAYEVQGVLAAFVDVAQEELKESNAIQLADHRGEVMVKLEPNVKGSMSDEEIKKITTAQHAEDSTIAIRTVAKAEDVTPDRLTWNVAAIVGVNFSKTFAQQKQAKKVASVKADAEDTTPTTPGNPGGVDIEA